ncbi:unnamed protein product [Rhizoctonia solani]|nr:unnamed protein product [Rhizoctonia solani]
MLLQRLTASDSSPGCSVGSMHTTLKGHLRSNNVLSCLSPEAAMSLFKHHLVLEKASSARSMTFTSICLHLPRV